MKICCTGSQTRSRFVGEATGDAATDARSAWSSPAARTVSVRSDAAMSSQESEVSSNFPHLLTMPPTLIGASDATESTNKESCLRAFY